MGKGCVFIQDSINRLLLWALVGGFVSATAPLRAQTIVFVDGDATGPVHDGTSWCSAYTDLQDTLMAATAGTEIRVADGTYKPGLGHLSTFRLKTGVAILGGFAGCGAADPGLRDLGLFESVLSGDLDGNDVEIPVSECCREHAAPGCEQETCQQVVCAERATCCTDQWDRLCAALAAIHCCLECGSRCENAYHVVSVNNVEGTDETAVLDGFTITGGFASGNNPSDRGAGIFMSGFSSFDPSRPTINNCRIRGNVARSKGAGVSNEFSDATYTNCAIYGNIAPLGAGVYNNNSSPSVVNCTVAGNTAQANAGGIWNILFEGQYVTLVNTLLWNNADDGGVDESAQMNIGIGNVIVNYSTIQGCTGLFGGIGNNGLDPLFADSAGEDGMLGTSDDDLTLTLGSPSINTGDPATEVENGAVDLNGRPRRAGCRVDRGAYESAESQAAFDFDADASVTLADYASLQVCFDATWLQPAQQDVCLCVFDADAGDSVDLDDFAAFAAAFNGP